jgi:hypothetical protein
VLELFANDEYWKIFFPLRTTFEEDKTFRDSKFRDATLGTGLSMLSCTLYGCTYNVYIFFKEGDSGPNLSSYPALGTFCIL